MSEDELIDDPECLAELELDPAAPQPVKRSLLYTLSGAGAGDQAEDRRRLHAHRHRPSRSASSTSTRRARCVRLKIGADEGAAAAAPEHRPGPADPDDTLVDALYRFADSVIAGDDRYAALEQLLRREPPRLRWPYAGPADRRAGRRPAARQPRRRAGDGPHAASTCRARPAPARPTPARA